MKKLVAMGFVAVAALFLYACGDSDESVALSPLHDAVYTGAGSVWTWTLTSSGTFTAIKKATSASTTEEMHIEGTYETFSTGFYKFTVGSFSGTESGPSAGDTAYGFSVPGTVLIVKPTGSGSETMVMPVLSGVCPTFPVAFNWVQASIKDHGSMETAEIGGNATVTSATATLVGKRWTLDGAASDMSSPPTFTGCTDGKMSFSDGHVALTSAGVGIVNNESGGGDIIAFPRDTSVTAATLASKSFVGLVFNDSGDETKPINVTFDASSVGTYAMLTDVETGATGDTGPVVVLETGAGEQAGFLKLKANGDTDSNPPTMWAAVATLSGHVTFFASGYNRNADGSAVANDNFSVIAVQK
jgi:hypothetical protein